jgi:hypothetical protein
MFNQFDHSFFSPFTLHAAMVIAQIVLQSSGGDFKLDVNIYKILPTGVSVTTCLLVISPDLIVSICVINVVELSTCFHISDFTSNYNNNNNFSNEMW